MLFPQVRFRLPNGYTLSAATCLLPVCYLSGQTLLAASTGWTIKPYVLLARVASVQRKEAPAGFGWQRWQTQLLEPKTEG